MSCAANSMNLGVNRMQAMPHSMFASDAFGVGCQQGCGYPHDCGSQYPTFKYMAETTGPCLFQPSFAESKLQSAVCQSCEHNYSAAWNSIPTPQAVVAAAGRPKSSCA